MIIHFILMQASLFLTLTNNQSQNYLINFNCLTNQNYFKLIMHGWFHPNKMHANRENLIMWFLSIQWFDLGIGHTIVTVRISRSFLWYATNELMHVMQLWFFGYMNGHSSHLPRLNHGCKIKCLQNAPHWQRLQSERQCKNKDIDFSSHELIEVEFSKIT